MAELKDKIRNRQLSAALKFNTEMIALYWDLGKAISEKIENSNWGEGIISQLAADLKSEFKGNSGFSRSNLFNIRKFYEFYIREFELVQQAVGLIEPIPSGPIIQRPVGQFPTILGAVPWGQHIQIFTKCKSVQEALFYIQQTTAHNWARPVLVYHIESKLFGRQAKALSNFALTLPKLQSDLAIELLKSPYNFGFLNLSAEVTERDFENALISNIKKFLQELGPAFAFVDQQYHLQVGDKDYYIDLLFYHTVLHCYLVIELKVNEFKPEYAGKMEFYITAIDRQLKTSNDNPTIGLLLCREVDKITVEYTLQNKSTPIGVAEYKYTHIVPEELKVYLPNEDIIREELSKKIESQARPIGEKMARLKDLLAKINAEEADLAKTSEIIKLVYSNIQVPLIELIKTRMLEFKPYFNNITIDYWYNERIHPGIMNEVDFANIILKEPDIWSLGFQFNMDGFKKAGIKAFNISYRLEIYLNKYKYSLGLGPGNLWDERVYRNFHAKEDLEKFADTYAEKILDDITQRMETLVQL